MVTTTTFLAALATFIQVSVSQKDPIKDFCRRFGHQTTVVDNKLFIDGGLVNYSPLSQNPGNYSNTKLLYGDINVDNQGFPTIFANLSKPDDVPSVSGGVLWPDTVNKRVFLYGGEFQNTPQSFSMWNYDIINNKWEAMSPDVTQNGVQRASFGAGAVIQDRGIGAFYGGWLSNTTNPTWGTAAPFALSNLLMYDMVKNQWTNATGPDSIGRAEGQMFYIPASDGGMLIYFGGVQSPANNGSWTGQPLDTIYIYDIANSKWYTQKAGGDVPDMRRRFCGDVAWSKDQSSYNIYIYGGASMPPNTVGFDDLYILSLPSFQWIKWYPDKPGAAYPHHSLSCNVINNAQMIVMGGTFPNSTDCDVPAIGGQHNADLGKQNADGAKWAKFDPKKTTYKVPSEIVSAVGGSADGSATAKSPKDGWSNPDLSVYFGRQYSIASTRTATRLIPATGAVTPSKNPGKSNTGAIIGGAVAGGIVALAILAGLVYFCLKKKNQHKEPRAEQVFTDPPKDANLSRMSQPAPVYAQQNYHHGEAIHQLPANEPVPVAELSAGHTSWGPVDNKSAGYTYVPQQSPPHSPPPASTSPSYFNQAPAPQYALYPQQQQQQQQQQHPYPQQFYTVSQSSPPAQHYSPPIQYPTPTSGASESGFSGPSPISGPPGVQRKFVPSP